MIAAYLETRKFDRIHLVIPFEGDPAITDILAKLRAALASFPVDEIAFQNQKELRKVIEGDHGHVGLVCPEDNIARALADVVAKVHKSDTAHQTEIVATQGTGVVTSPHSRLRYDYRRLGRAAASHLLHGTPFKPMRPSLVTSLEDEV